MNFTEYIGQYEKVEQSLLETVPAFFTRLKIARKLLSGDDDIDHNRSLVTPHYLSDLGVRRLKDANEYAFFITQRFGTKLPDDFSLMNEIQLIPIDKLKYWLDIVVLLTGDYAALISVILKRREEILVSNDYRLLLYSGTLLAAENNRLYREMFRKAHGIVGITKEEQLVMLHRIAVSELKRGKNLSSFQNTIREMLAYYESGNYNDFLVVLALINNLYGLFLVKQDSGKVTLPLIMVNADIILQVAYEKENNAVRRDMIMRYLGQVSINRAQLCLFNNEILQSKRILEFALNRGLRERSEYVSEIFALLALVEYKCKNYKKSLIYAKDALKRYRLIGHTSGMREIYKIMILSYFEMKSFDEVNELTTALEQNDRKLFL